jgi:hypothetical protein
MPVLATLVTGYGDLADWLMLLAVALFIAAGALGWSTYTPGGTTPAARVDPTRGSLIAFGLAAAALAWLVL